MHMDNNTVSILLFTVLLLLQCCLKYHSLLRSFPNDHRMHNNYAQ